MKKCPDSKYFTKKKTDNLKSLTATITPNSLETKLLSVNLIFLHLKIMTVIDTIVKSTCYVVLIMDGAAAPLLVWRTLHTSPHEYLYMYLSSIEQWSY